MNSQSPPEPTPAPDAPKRNNWLRRRLDGLIGTAAAIAKNPRSIATLAHESALTIWGSRGGGFYGLGCLIAFVVLEIRMFTTDAVTSDSVIGFLGMELLTLIFRFAFQSILNSLIALLWPAFVLQLLGGWGIVLLAGGWWGYGRWIAPYFQRRGLAPPPKVG